MRAEVRTQHLTDAEFSRLLDGAQPGASLEAHLTFCECCRQEIAAVQDSLGSFRALATTWAEVEAPRRLPLPARWLPRLGVQASWSSGFAATAITGLLVFWLGFPPHLTHGPVMRAPAAAPSTADLAADNRLLLSIDEELSDQVPPVDAAAELPAGPRHSAHHAVGTLTD